MNTGCTVYCCFFCRAGPRFRPFGTVVTRGSQNSETTFSWQIFGIVPYTLSPFKFAGFLNVYNSLKVNPLAGDLSFA